MGDSQLQRSARAWLAYPWSAPLVLALAAIAMATWTWGTYCDPFVDFGREIYVAWRLSAGEVLYRDIDYFNGPVSPYLNGAIFRIFGSSLLNLEMANLVWWTILVAMAYRLYIALSDRFTAFAATLLFILLFSFIQLTGIGNYNFVTPYAHEVTHSLVCAFAALTLLWIYLRQPSRVFSPAIIGCGLLLGMIFLMKVEVTIATAGAIAVGIGSKLFVDRASVARWAATFAVVFAATIVPSIIALALLRLSMPAHQAIVGLLGSWKYLRDPRITDNPFYRKLMGIDQPGARTIVMLKIFACELLPLAPPAIVAMLLRRSASTKACRAAAAGGVVYVIVLVYIFWSRFNWDASMRPLNLIMVCTVLALSITVIRQRVILAPRLILQLSFSVFALLLLAKMFFNAAIYHYGFALAWPAFTLLVIALLRWIPRLIQSAGGTGWVFRAVAISALGMFCLKHLSAYEKLYGSRTVQTIGDSEDQFQVPRDGEEINRTLKFLSKLPPDQTVAAVPQGAMINYLSRRTNPTGEPTLLPGEVEMFGDRRILDRFRQHPPDWIVMVQTDVSSFGFKDFGVDYAQGIEEFIHFNYKAVPLNDSNRPPSDLRLLKRE